MTLERPTRILAWTAALLSAAVSSAAGQLLQDDDILVLRSACSGGVTASVIEAYRPGTGAFVFASLGGTPDCWEGVTRLPGGRFAAARKIPSGVNVFNEIGWQTHSFATPEVSFAGDLAVFSDGTFAVVDLFGDIELYSPAGQHVGTFSHPSLLLPSGIHVDADDVLWVTNLVSSSHLTGSIARFDRLGTWLGTFNLPNQCEDLVVAPDGTVWTIGVQDGKAHHYSAAGAPISSFAVFPINSVARGIGMSSDGTLVFAAAGEKDVLRYDQAGTLLSQLKLFASGPLNFRLDVVTSARWNQVGVGLAGSSGVPQLAGLGTLIGGSVTQLSLTNAAPNAASVLVVGAQRVDLPLLGGTLVPSADVLLQAIPTSGGGEWTLGSVWPPGIPSYAKIFFQVWVPDASGPQGYAASNGLKASTP